MSERALMGVLEVAEYLRVTPQAVYYYRAGERRADIKFPEPCAELRMGPVWTLESIMEFKRKLGQRQPLPKE